MEIKREFKILAWIIAIFLFAFFLPLDSARFQEAVTATLDLSKWYAREHVILCLLPAFFIAGVIAVFVSQGAVMKYFGAKAKKWLAYTVAAVSGTILAVCSCTILPCSPAFTNAEPVWDPPSPFCTADPPSTSWPSSLPPVF